MSPKVALFYDWINQWGGAERLLLNIHSLFPKAPIYTLYHHPKKTPWAKNLKIIPSVLNKLPLSTHHPSPYTPFHPMALEEFDLSGFDILISITSQSGHAILTKPNTLHLNYCLTPNRYLWLHPPSYLKPVLKPLQTIDHILAQRPDHFLTTSKTVQERIKKSFQRESTLVHPGVDTSFFVLPKNKVVKERFLLVSRLVAHKKVDLAIKAFNKTQKKLLIVGQGRQVKYLKSIAGPNIEFSDPVTAKKLLFLYQNSKALICPQKEDFGFTPLESMASGSPVIAFKAGGHAETISPKTGLFFNKQTSLSLVKALNDFEKQSFNSQDCRKQALKFSQNKFMINFKSAVQKLWQFHQKTITS